ncbi:NusG domain II-containing protein [Candidatus Poribacteria bacterium]|nr:NusG domain II-containing protein [Candidatus Poribacteria bacterium]
MFTRYDKLLIVFLLAAGLLSFVLIRIKSTPSNTVVVEVDGKEASQYNLETDGIFSIEGPRGKTRIEIKNKRVRVIESPCPKKICIQSGWIYKSYQTIVCVPNRVTIHLGRTREDNEVDGITE